MRYLALLLLVAPAFAAPLIIADPIPVSGTETFQYDWLDGGYIVSFSGATADHSAGVFYSGGCCGFGVVVPSADGSTIQGHAFGVASIDQIGSPWFVFSLGHLAIYDDSNFDNLLASASLVGYPQLTSFVVQGTGFAALKSGTVAIVPTPEPSTVILGLVGLLGLYVKRNRIAR